MTDKRFKRYLFDGGFSFGEEYVPPKWSISDENTKGSPFGFLEFDDEHKDLCDEIVDSLNEFVDEYNHLKEENEELKTKNNAYIQDIEVFKEENTHLKLENEQLKNICKNLINEINKRGITVTMTDNCRELLE